MTVVNVPMAVANVPMAVRFVPIGADSVRARSQARQKLARGLFTLEKPLGSDHKGSRGVASGGARV
jgi:hypothetical protein